MIGRFFKWLFSTGNQEIHIHVNISLDGKNSPVETRVLHDQKQASVITSPVQTQPRVTSHIRRETPDISPSEVAKIISAGGTQPIVDKTEHTPVKKTDGKSVDVQVESLRKITQKER